MPLVVAACVPSSPPGGALARERAEATDYPVNRAGVSVLVGAGDDRAGLGASRAGTGRGGHYPDCVRAWPRARLRSRVYQVFIILPCWPRHMGKAGQVEEGLDCGGRGTGFRGQNWGALVARPSCIGLKES